MQKRKQLSKKRREAIYNSYNGKCAYCGCKIEYRKMQVDHIVPLCNGGEDVIGNLLPACRSCNQRKDTLSLEKFRQNIEDFLKVLKRDSSTYRNAVRFGLIIPNPHPIKFYFEKTEDQK